MKKPILVHLILFSIFETVQAGCINSVLVQTFSSVSDLIWENKILVYKLSYYGHVNPYHYDIIVLCIVICQVHKAAVEAGWTVGDLWRYMQHMVNCYGRSLSSEMLLQGIIDRHEHHFQRDGPATCEIWPFWFSICISERNLGQNWDPKGQECSGAGLGSAVGCTGWVWGRVPAAKGFLSRVNVSTVADTRYWYSNSVCPSVPIMYQNGLNCHHTVFGIW